MTETAESAIKELIEKAGAAAKSEDAMRFTQSALNTAHILSVLRNIKL